MTTASLNERNVLQRKTGSIIIINGGIQEEKGREFSRVLVSLIMCTTSKQQDWTRNRKVQEGQQEVY